MLYHPKGDDKLVLDKNTPRTYFLLALLILLVGLGVFWVMYYREGCKYATTSGYTPGPCFVDDINKLIQKL